MILFSNRYKLMPITTMLQQETRVTHYSWYYSLKKPQQQKPHTKSKKPCTSMSKMPSQAHHKSHADYVAMPSGSL